MKHKLIGFFTLLILVACIAGCEKDQDFLATAKQGASDGAGFGLSNRDQINVTIDASVTTLDTTLKVFLSKTFGTATSVSLIVDTSVVNQYNADNGTAYDYMPDGVFTLPASISIAAGSKEGDGTLSVDIASMLTHGSAFALGVSISGVSGGTSTILTDNSRLFILIQVKNKYDGTYNLDIKTVGWSAYGIADGVAYAWPSDVTLFTTGPNTVMISTAEVGNLQPAFTTAGNQTGFGATGPQFAFDVATDKLLSVTNTVPDDGRARAFHLNPAVTDSRYDPSTKTIYAAYIMTQTGRPDQQIYDTLVAK